MEPTGKTQAILKRLPAFYATEGEGALLYNLVEVFGQLLEQTETDLYRVMRSHFVDTADNDASQGLGSDHPGDLDRLFALYLESLGLTAQVAQIENHNKSATEALTDSANPYRQRLKALIKVLRQGAATQQGIRDIVAANLGIFDETPADMQAKEQITIEEFAPQRIVKRFTLHPYTESAENDPDHTFTLNNPNIVPTRADFQIEIDSTVSLPPLTSLRLVNVQTQEYYEFSGRLPVNSTLRISADGQLSRNAKSMAPQGLPPWLPPKTSTWYVEVKVSTSPVGRFDSTQFDLSDFGLENEQPADLKPSTLGPAINISDTLTPETARLYTITLTASLIQQTPARFRVRVPWDIPGYTDKFDEGSEHPRRQIPQIIEKVKAAGVLAVIAYEKRWTETHRHYAQLGMVRSPFTENQNMTETNFDIDGYQEAYPNGLHHNITDSFTTAGMFDYTSFDSGNRFG